MKYRKDDPSCSSAVPIMNVITFLAGIALILSVSIEVAVGNRNFFSQWFLYTQLGVCAVFIIDYFVRVSCSCDGSAAMRFLPFLLLSLPYLNFVVWSGVHIDRGMQMLLGVIPLLRTLAASLYIVRIFTARGVRRLFAAYALALLLFTYLSGMIFYDYEIGINPHLQGFGNAIWWAFMGMTTVGAAIFPVTTIGKVLAAALPALGMLMLPLFTAYITDLYKRKHSELNAQRTDKK